MSTYVCGDIHGQFTLYRKMLEKIRFSDNDHLYVIGDVIDRGPESIGILRDLMSRKNAELLLGNHELMMYDHLTGNREYDCWFNGSNGGEKTMEEYAQLSPWERVRIRKFIRRLLLQKEVRVNGTTFLLSHSSFISGAGDVHWKAVPYKTASDTVWDSPWRFFEFRDVEDYKEDGRVHIIGHVPVQGIRAGEWPSGKKPEMPAALVNRDSGIVNIDLGCAKLATGIYRNGECLCCLNLEAFAEGKTEEAFVYTKPDED